MHKMLSDVRDQIVSNGYRARNRGISFGGLYTHIVLVPSDVL